MILILVILAQVFFWGGDCIIVHFILIYTNFDFFGEAQVQFDILLNHSLEGDPPVCIEIPTDE